jgi:hypothetical protein
MNPFAALLRREIPAERAGLRSGTTRESVGKDQVEAVVAAILGMPEYKEYVAEAEKAALAERVQICNEMQELAHGLSPKIEAAHAAVCTTEAEIQQGRAALQTLIVKRNEQQIEHDSLTRTLQFGLGMGQKRLEKSSHPSISVFHDWANSEQMYTLGCTPPLETGHDGSAGFDQSVRQALLRRAEALKDAVMSARALRLEPLSPEAVLGRLRELYASIPAMPRGASEPHRQSRMPIPAFLTAAKE